MTQRVKVNLSRKKNDRTSVPNIFLDQYMRDANGDFVKVYLYLLRCTNEDDSAASVCEIADLLNLSERDVIRALKYWVRVGVLDVDFNEESSEPTSITFRQLEENTGVAPVVSASAIDSRATTDSAISNASSDKPARSRVSRDKAARLKEQEDIRQLFFVVEKYIGRPINSTESNTILYFYDSLGFSSELIEYLVEYCVNNGHASMRYMETVAIAWQEQGISSVSDAKEMTHLRSRQVRSVLKTFGTQDRAITPAEMEFIDRWYKEYHFSEEIVTEACKRTILSLGKPNFSYTEKVLKDWYTNGVKTLEDVKARDAKFYQSKTMVQAQQSAPKVATKPNQFNDFAQRTYNFKELEKQIIGSSNQ